AGGEELLVCARATVVDELLKGVAVVPLVHVHRSCHGAISEPERGELSGGQISPHDKSIFRRVGEASALTAKVVRVEEEERQQLIRRLGAQQVACDMQSLIFGIGPVLYPDPASILRM